MGELFKPMSLHWITYRSNIIESSLPLVGNVLRMHQVLNSFPFFSQVQSPVSIVPEDMRRRSFLVEKGG